MLTPGKNKFLVFFLLVAICAGGLYFVLNSEWFWGKALPGRINASLKDVRISDVKIARRKFEFPGKFLGEEIECLVTYGEKDYSAQLKNLKVSWAPDLSSGQQAIKIDVRGLNVTSSDMSVQNANISARMTLTLGFQKAGLKQLRGSLAVKRGGILNVRLTDIQSIFSGSQDKIEFHNFLAHLFGGQMSGQISLEHHDDITYSIVVGYTNIDVTQLESIHAGTFSQMKGRVDGQIYLQGSAADIHTLRATFKAPRGGEVKASLLEPIIERIPAETQQRKDLEILINRDGFVVCEKAYGQIENITEDRLNGNIHFSSAAFNLNVKYPVKIYMEGGFLNFFKNKKGTIFHPPVSAESKYSIKEMTPQVKAALEKRRARYDTLRQYKAEGIIGENNRGYTESLTHNEKAKLLVDAENQNRKVIYKTIAQQNNLKDAMETIEKVFASIQRDKAQPGDKIQLDSGEWEFKENSK